MYTMEEFDNQKTKVLKYILYKKRSEQEVRTKFEKVIDEDMLDDIIEYLKEADYINDKEYIEKAVNNFMNLKNLSMKELQYKLMAKGLDRDDIEDYFYENREILQNYEIKSAKNMLIKKESDMEANELIQYLLKKGYKLENIKKALEEES